jgi:ankyrin repeat protein
MDKQDSCSHLNITMRPSMYKEFNSKEFPVITRDIYLKYIFRRLSLRDIVRFGQTRKVFLTLSRDKKFWYQVFANHFPHYKLNLAFSENLDWYFIFILASQADYGHLAKHEQLIFLNAKQGDLAAIFIPNGKNNKAIVDSLINLFDCNALKPIDWILRHKQQVLLDTIFKEVQVSAPQDILSIVKWAMICHQPTRFIQACLPNVLHNEKLILAHYAASYGLHEILTFLRANNFNFNFRADYNHTLKKKKSSMAAIHFAAIRGHVEAVRVLLEAGVNPEQEMIDTYSIEKENRKVTPLHLAAKNGHVEVAELLLAKDCSPFEPDSFGNSPIRYAIQRNHIKLFELFWGLKEKYREKNTDFNDFLNKMLVDAIVANSNFFIPPLLAAGADPKQPMHYKNFQDRERTALDIAFQEENREALLLLIPERDFSNINYKPPRAAAMYAFSCCMWGTIVGGLLDIVFLMIARAKQVSPLVVLLVALIILCVVIAVFIYLGCCLGRKLENISLQQAKAFAVSSDEGAALEFNPDNADAVPLLERKPVADIETGTIDSTLRKAMKEVFNESENPKQSLLLKKLGMAFCEQKITLDLQSTQPMIVELTPKNAL